jgi:aspartyl/asparaginyl beta-hydroxylase (cupin superfamily)
MQMQRALCRRVLGDFAGALLALDAALAIDPYDFLAHLSKGAVLERMGRPRTAAHVYRDALKLAPATPMPALEAPLRRARELVAEDDAALETHVQAALRPLRAAHGASARFDHCVDLFLGKTKPYYPDPAQVLFPRLPAEPFLDDAFFPWMTALEAQTDVIRAELEQVMREDWGAFEPYIQRSPGAPVNQWAELNRNPAWSTFHLWRDGIKIEAHCARCPQTTRILEGLPMADQPGFTPTAMFSVLAPHTHIPPHTGSSNTRVILHLPLILPEKCTYRVGNEWRDWRMGKAWVFDDTIEHEARNDSDHVRVLLIFDLWNPYLTGEERALVSAMMTARRAYAAQG